MRGRNRRRIGVAACAVVVIAGSLATPTLRYRLQGRNACGFLPVPADALGVLSERWTMLETRSAAGCQGGWASPTTRWFRLAFSPSADPVAAFVSDLGALGWRPCPDRYADTSSDAGACLVSPGRRWLATGRGPGRARGATVPAGEMDVVVFVLDDLSRPVRGGG